MRRFVEGVWDDSVYLELVEYIRIPNRSPAFDPEWESHGFMEAAVARFARWARAQPIAGMALEVIRLPGRTPLMFMDIPGDPRDCVLLYGHLDKQPEMTGWRSGLGPWQPVLEGDKLYGRGGADDGYAMFASLTAIAALQEQGLPHARCVVIIEACEESGSFDLPYYIDALADRIGLPSLVICLDSGCSNYDQLWCTTSLRGLIGGTLIVEILTEGVHSGDASGIVACTFRIQRQLLSRLEDAASGEILPADFHAEIPAERRHQATAAAEALGVAVFEKFPICEGARPVADEPSDLVLNRTWRPALSIVGARGLPAIENAGNVLRPSTSLKLSLRLPPTRDAAVASRRLQALLENDPPYGARVSFQPDWAATGWNAPALAPWLERSVDAASRAFFGERAMYMGEGGTIPFMGMLGGRYPRAQFLITGVLGPHSNAHGPNEFLHLPTAKRLTCCVAQVLTDHSLREDEE